MTDMSINHESAAKIILIWEAQPDSETGNINAEETNYGEYCAYVSQYREDRTWIGSVRIRGNWKARVVDIFKTKEEAKAFVEELIKKPSIEIINCAAAEHLEALKEIGYAPLTSIDYSTGYDDGYKAALAKLTEFLNIEQPNDGLKERAAA